MAGQSRLLRAARASRCRHQTFRHTPPLPSHEEETNEGNGGTAAWTVLLARGGDSSARPRQAAALQHSVVTEGLKKRPHARRV